jgi:hypothetical protein
VSVTTAVAADVALLMKAVTVPALVTRTEVFPPMAIAPFALDPAPVVTFVVVPFRPKGGGCAMVFSSVYASGGESNS